MNLKLEIEFSKADIFNQVDALKKQIDDMRPLPPDVEGRVMQKLRLDWNYNSNAIEGNKLSYGETTALLMHGMTAKGKPLKDHLDIQGHNEAIELLERMVKDERPLTETDIRGLHEVILGKPHTAQAQTADGTPTTKTITVGEYKNLPNHVKTITGEIHYYASPEETPAKMQELMEWYYDASASKEIHPIVTAALFHHRFVAIHPFDDGNGRMSRILMNLILMRNGYPVAVIKNDNKDEYYSLLSRADVGENFPFVEYIIEKVENSLRLYIKAVEGGDIDEDEDIDKEIALFKMELKDNVLLSEKKTPATLARVIKTDIRVLFEKLFIKSGEFNEFFFSNNVKIWLVFGPSVKTSFEVKNLESLEGILYQIADVTSSYYRIDIEFYFNEFRHPTNNFSIESFISVVFNDYTFEILNNLEDAIFLKLYHEALTSKDVSVVIKSLFAGIKGLITHSIKKA
ncbi:Fic family protein [Mucilaginibacter terrae]|uniref:Fic family protein n=1 Tax=Mucilaginibacter terrae TaxID=1955052 RepID=A0ABU3H373_9SPHI|nr:Fic family protein [Mucilaginibacter terrae]MDT3405667.1 Fic family protein [Mucilaginibacter terrae]